MGGLIMNEIPTQPRNKFPIGRVILNSIGWIILACIFGSIVGGMASAFLGVPSWVLTPLCMIAVIIFAFITNWAFFKAWGLTPYISVLFGLASLVMWVMPLIGFPISLIALIMSFISYNYKNNAWSIVGLICGLLGLIGTVVNSVLGVYAAMQ